jgi:MFS family permease
MSYAILIVSAVLLELAVNLPTGSLPLALAADGVRPAGIATVASIAAVAPLLGSVPVGGLVDRFGRILTCRISAGVAAPALAFVHGTIGAIALAGAGPALALPWVFAAGPGKTRG